MLDKETEKKIYDFLASEPKTIQEISQMLGRSWLTASKYVEKLSKYGLISYKTFREGTRGALKIAYLTSNNTSLSSSKKYVKTRIMSGSHKQDFSPSEIYQYSKGEAIWLSKEMYEKDISYFKKILYQADEEILIFSGNLSFVNYSDGKQNMIEILQELIDRGIVIKIICRIDIVGYENITKLLELNKSQGKELISVRHAHTPLRGVIIDKKLVSLTEHIAKNKFRDFEVQSDQYIIYKIFDEDWVNFLYNIFWQYYRASIAANKRIEIFNEIKKL